MKATERLACLTAMEKAIKDEIRLARAEANEELEALYQDKGVERRALTVGGYKVGEHAVVYGREGFDVVDEAAFEDFALCNGLATQETRTVYLDHWQEFLEHGDDGRVVVYGTDEEVPGVEWRPCAPKGTRVTGCKPADVIPLLRQIEGGAQALLEGKEE